MHVRMDSMSVNKGVIGVRKHDERRDTFANCSASVSHDTHRHPDHTSFGSEAGKVVAKLSAAQTHRT